MVLNAYDSAILKSQMDFSIWAMKKGIKNPVEKKIESEKEGETAKYNKLIKEGFEVTVHHLQGLLCHLCRKCIVILLMLFKEEFIDLNIW